MKQILRIFRKDLRHHWPETLLSLLLLALYCWKEVREQQFRGGAVAYSALSYIPWLEFVSVLLPLAWFVLVVRLVQDEALVGDRQWWVTKPYEWPSILASKVLFLVLWLGVPLFFAKCFLLRAAGFAIAPHLAGLLRQHATNALLFAFFLIVAVLTRNVGHTVIAIIGLFLLGTGLSSFSRFIPNESLQPLQDVSGTLSGMILLLAGVVVVLWQYSRRKTFWTRTVVFSAIATLCLINVLTPYRALMERKYPTASPGDEPFHLALRSVAPAELKPAEQDQTYGKQENALLRLPLQISGIAPGGFIVIDAEQLTVEDSAGGKWAEPWTAGRQELWPEDNAIWQMYSVKNSAYQKLKSQPVTLRLEMAVTQYRLSDERELTIVEHEFRVPSLGICGSPLPLRNNLTCRLPFVSPAFVAMFDATTAKCPVTEESHDTVPALHFVNFGYRGESALINPVNSYSIFFSQVGQGSATNPPRPQNLCPGDVLHLSTPVVSRHVRMTASLGSLQMEKFSLNQGSGRAVLGVAVGGLGIAY